jgi:hypothetical protein
MAQQQTSIQKANVLDFFGLPAAPANPPVNEARMYYNSTLDTFHVIDSNGAELLSSGGGVTSVFGSTGAITTLTAASGDTITFSGTGIVNANEINGIVITGTPSIGQVLTATSPTAANWQTAASAPSLTLAVTPINTAAYAINAHTPGTYIVLTAGVNSMTLAAPTVTTDDGKVIKVTLGTSAAHTITCTGGTLRCGTASVTTVNFASFYGSSIELMAYQGLWYVMAQNLIASYA